MYVGSLPELHLMAFGWMLYDNFWSVLAFVGLVMFPFTWMVATAVFDAVKRHGFAGADAPIAAFHTVFPSFLLMMGIYAIAGLPTVSLDVQNWEYTKLCTANGTPQPQAPIMTPGNTGTPLDTAQQLAAGALRPADARVPILWDLLHRIGAGMSRALNSGGACPTHSNYLDKELRKMSFSSDPGLQAELGQFVKDCYLPARGRFMRAMQSGTLDTVPTPASAVNPDQYFAARYRDWRANPPPNQRVDEVFDRNHDPDYLGSRFFLVTPGLYAPAIPGQYDQQVDTLKASQAIAGWPYDPFRDCQRNNAAAGGFCTDPTRNSDMANNYGSPTCDEWWTNGTRGLRLKLVDAAERSSAIASGGFPLMQNGQPMTMGQALNQVITNTSGTPRSDGWMADKLIATTLANDTVTQESLVDKAMDILDMPIDGDDGEATRGSGSNFLMETIVGAGTFMRSLPARATLATTLAANAVDFYAAAWVVKQAYPIMQAYLMLFFITMLPFMLIGSMYDIGRLLQIALIFLAIQFLSPWRYVVEYLDERLFEIMYPDQFALWGTDIILKTKERVILDITTTAMYTLFPAILLWLTTLAGAETAKAAGEAFRSDKLNALSSGLIKGLSRDKKSTKP